MSIISINPYTGEPIKEYAALSNGEAADKVKQGHQAFLSWKETDLDYRSNLMHQAARLLRERKASLARLMALEMGKPLAQGESEAEKCAWVCDYYADKAAEFLEPEPVTTEARSSYVAFEPLGLVLAIMPWNFPLWQVFRFAAPALMAGNGGLLKHASNVPGSALAIEDIFLSAGFPRGIFQTLLISSSQVEDLIANPLVKAATLTGSTPAGKAVAAACGANLKKVVLELGGSDPYLILEDADLEQAARICAASRLINSGQSCIAAKRFIVVESVKARFEALFTKALSEYKTGDPLDPEVKVGPMARKDLRDELHDQVRRSLAQGARLLLGGEIPQGDSALYPVTLLTDVSPKTPAYVEELFGPVAAIIPVPDEEAAIRAANDTIFGLGAAVFTRDVVRGEEIARRKIEAGCCFVNEAVKSDPRLPFGGIKESGYGRELSHFGLHEFVNIKTVWVGNQP